MFGKHGSIGFVTGAYVLRGRSGAGLIRVLAMILTFAIRTAHAVIYIARGAIDDNRTALIVGCICGFIGTFAMIICIAQVGSARGRARVWGINWGRWHFDTILALTLAISIVLIVLALISEGRALNNSLFAAWCILWAIFSVFAYIATRVGFTESYV